MNLFTFKVSLTLVFINVLHKINFQYSKLQTLYPAMEPMLNLTNAMDRPTPKYFAWLFFQFPAVSNLNF
jgi:hypothetical protein